MQHQFNQLDNSNIQINLFSIEEIPGFEENDIIHEISYYDQEAFVDDLLSIANSLNLLTCKSSNRSNELKNYLSH